MYAKNCLYIGSEERQDGAIPFPVRTKYTETNAGQKVKGGFKNDGVNQAIAWARSCMNARATKAARKKEETCMENLREEYGIEGQTYAEEQKRTGKKAKVTKDPTVPAPEKIAVSMKDYDVEEEVSSEDEGETPERVENGEA